MDRTLNMKIRLDAGHMALEIGVPGSRYGDEDRFLAFGYDTSVYIDRPWTQDDNNERRWYAEYQVGGIGQHPAGVAEDRIAAYAKAVQVGESVVAWLNLQDKYEMKRTYEYLTSPAFRAMAGIEEAR